MSLADFIVAQLLILILLMPISLGALVHANRLNKMAKRTIALYIEEINRRSRRGRFK